VRLSKSETTKALCRRVSAGPVSRRGSTQHAEAEKNSVCESVANGLAARSQRCIREYRHFRARGEARSMYYAEAAD
jgi:hypothetical protein